mmetsp:Transcript_21143/g.49893  ORF Transcript_21143/g.49893 Transcript_21143/m.49893 type:complete len:220 (-) Transcript_21143:798-1457(-)
MALFLLLSAPVTRSTFFFSFLTCLLILHSIMRSYSNGMDCKIDKSGRIRGPVGLVSGTVSTSADSFFLLRLLPLSFPFLAGACATSFWIGVNESTSHWVRIFRPPAERKLAILLTFTLSLLTPTFSPSLSVSTLDKVVSEDDFDFLSPISALSPMAGISFSLLLLLLALHSSRLRFFPLVFMEQSFSCASTSVAMTLSCSIVRSSTARASARSDTVWQC